MVDPEIPNEVQIAKTAAYTPGCTIECGPAGGNGLLIKMRKAPDDEGGALFRISECPEGRYWIGQVATHP
jgi:hypothetical protein